MGWLQGMSKKILACGVGVQTVAETIRNYNAYDYIVFSDTGSEKPETYWYLKTHLLPFVEKNKINFIVVKNEKYLSLYDYCYQHEQVPMRNFRWCTDKFKRQPINKFIKSLGAKKADPVIKAIGISLDESHRLNTFNQMKEPKYVKLTYPLIDDKITRDDCYKIIKDANMPVPVKSGCWFCPFAKKEEWRRLKIEKPDLFAQAVALEKHNEKYPERTLKFTKPLEDVNFNFSLDDFDDMDECDSGHCFV